LRSNGLYLELSILKNNNGRLEGQYYKQLANLGGESGLPPVLIKNIMTVYLLQHKETMLILGCFQTEEKAIKYVNGSENVAIKKLEVL